METAAQLASTDVLVQVHIPKCAGTSVAEWLRLATFAGALTGFGAFYPDFIFSDEGLWQVGLHDPRLTALSAHNIRRFPPKIHDRRLHYFTILRRPLPHFLSIVRYMLQERTAYAVPAAVGDALYDMARWLLERPAGSGFRENSQTNHLALYPWCDATAGRCDPSRYETWSKADRSAYERERLDVAKAVLRSFLVVGTVERLHDTLEVLRVRSAQHGLQLLEVEALPWTNVTKIPIGDVSWLEHDPLGKRVVESLAVDTELYAYAERLLDEALAREGCNQHRA